MKAEKYNGWTNYETWRVYLEIFDGMRDLEEIEITPDWCQDYAEEAVLDFGNIDSSSLAASYALAFLDEVNWREIANHLNEA